MPEPRQSDIFVPPPQQLPQLESCSFYHSIDLPKIGAQIGLWDLRGRYDEYFGGNDFAGKRVLDLGTASGALAFEIERRGAGAVVAFDLADGLTYDCRLPTDAATLKEFSLGVGRVKNAFWLARGLLESQVNVVYGHVGALPPALGWFDVVMMGNILQHLQDPVGAVLQAIQHTDHLLVTEADWLPGIGDDLACMLLYDVPNPFSWYQVKPLLLQNLLRRWGFTQQALTWHDQILLSTHQFTDDGRSSWEKAESPTKHYTLSARRPSSR